MGEVDNPLGGGLGECFKKTSSNLGCENWDRYDFNVLKLVKSVVLIIWTTRRNRLHGTGDQDGETSVCSCPLTGSYKLCLHM